MRAGGHTRIRGKASRGDCGGEGVFMWHLILELNLFASFPFCFGRQWRRIGPAGRKGVCLVSSP